MAGRGCDVSGPSAGHCLYRNQPMKSGGDCRNPDSPVLQICACALSPRRATLDRGREWPHGGLGKQSLEMAWEGLFHRPGPPTWSWFTGPGIRTRSPRSQSLRVRRLGVGDGMHGAGRCWASQGGAPRGLVWGREQRQRAPGCGLQGAEVLVWVSGRGFSGRLWGELCLCKGPWRGQHWVGGDLPSSHAEALEPLQPSLCFLLKSPGQEQKPVWLQSPTQRHRGPRRLCSQGWCLGRLLQGPRSQQVTWDLCWDSGHLSRVSWVLLLLLLLLVPLFLLLLPTLFLPMPFSPPLPPPLSTPFSLPLPPTLLPYGCQSQIKGLKAYTGCLFYFICVMFYFKFILQSLTPTPHQNISSSSPLSFFSSTF